MDKAQDNEESSVQAGNASVQDVYSHDIPDNQVQEVQGEPGKRHEGNQLRGICGPETLCVNVAAQGHGRPSQGCHGCHRAGRGDQE